MDVQSGTVFCLFRLSNPPTPSPPAMHYAAGSTSSRSGRRRGAPASACGHSAIALVAAFEVVGHITRSLDNLLTLHKGVLYESPGWR